MKKQGYLLIVGLFAAGGFALFHYQQPAEDEPLKIPARVDPPPPVMVGEPDQPVIRYPLREPLAGDPPAPSRQPAGPQQEPESRAGAPVELVPLPALDESDAALRRELAPLVDPGQFESLFNPYNLVRRFVVTVDNLPRKMLPRRKYLSTRSTSGRFLVSGKDEEITIDPENFRRYHDFVQLLESVHSENLVAVYVYFYPLFQAAYEDLGYPSRYFNDRLIDVIDHLLETPEPEGAIRLTRPHVLYKFADPDLEALSSGQKVLIRIGPDNAARIKAKLHELRRVLVKGVAVG